MDTITNFKLHQFLRQDPALIEEYINLLKYCSAIETKQPIYHMKLKHVDRIKQDLFGQDDEALIEIVCLVEELEFEDVLQMKIVHFFGLINSITAQVLRIIKGEQNGLQSDEVDVKWEFVNGSERMSKFGIYNTLDRLSNGDPTKYPAILEMPYSDVFTILLMMKTKDDLNREMSKIKTST